MFMQIQIKKLMKILKLIQLVDMQNLNLKVRII